MKKTKNACSKHFQIQLVELAVSTDMDQHNITEKDKDHYDTKSVSVLRISSKFCDGVTEVLSVMGLRKVLSLYSQVSEIATYFMS